MMGLRLSILDFRHGSKAGLVFLGQALKTRQMELFRCHNHSFALSLCYSRELPIAGLSENPGGLNTKRGIAGQQFLKIDFSHSNKKISKMPLSTFPLRTVSKPEISRQVSPPSQDAPPSPSENRSTGIPNTPVVSGSASRAQQLLKQCRHKKMCAGSLHDLGKTNIDALGEALNLSLGDRDTDEKKREITCALKKVINYAIGSGESNYTDTTAAQLKNYFPSLTDDDVQALQRAMDTVHLRIGINQLEDAPRIALHFGGSQNVTDFLQNLSTAAGLTGTVYQLTLKAAEIFAKVLQDPDSSCKLDMLSGHSMGGGAAQFFKAALESRVKLEHKPIMVLFDPQLMNKSQKADAIKGGKNEYCYKDMQGLALTLNYPKNPQDNLMALMQEKGGYSAEGLQELEIQLKPRLRSRPVMTEDQQTLQYEIEEPVPTPLGYHNDFSWFDTGLQDFLKDADLSATPPSFQQELTLWEQGGRNRSSTGSEA